MLGIQAFSYPNLYWQDVRGTKEINGPVTGAEFPPTNVDSFSSYAANGAVYFKKDFFYGTKGLPLFAQVIARIKLRRNLMKLCISAFVLICGIFACLFLIFPLHKNEYIKNPSALSVTTLNASHHAPHLNNYKVTNQTDTKELYNIIMNSKPFPNGPLSCPMDSGIQYQLTFIANGQSLDVLAEPSGCGLTVINNSDKRMLTSEKFWTILANDAHSTRLDMRGN
jgi:hypothetical protein